MSVFMFTDWISSFPARRRERKHQEKIDQMILDERLRRYKRDNSNLHE